MFALDIASCGRHAVRLSRLLRVAYRAPRVGRPVGRAWCADVTRISFFCFYFYLYFKYVYYENLISIKQFTTRNFTIFKSWVSKLNAKKIKNVYTTFEKSLGTLRKCLTPLKKLQRVFGNVTMYAKKCSKTCNFQNNKYFPNLWSFFEFSCFLKSWFFFTKAEKRKKIWGAIL